MSVHEYYEALKLKRADAPFYSLIMAAMLRADDRNIQKLRYIFPEVYEELKAHYHSPGGEPPEDKE